MTDASITIRTDTGLAAKLTALAIAMDRSRNSIIEEMVRQYVETQAWQVEGIKEAISSMDRGEGIDHEAVMSEMDALLAHQGGPT